MSTMFSFQRSDAADVGDKRFDGAMDGDFTPIPTHWYAGQITEDKMQPTGGGDGQALNTTWELIGKHYAGRKVFMNIGTGGSEGFVKMGKLIMLSIFDALNINGFQQTGELHKKPMAIKVVHVPAQYEEDGVTVKYKAKSEIKGIMPLNQLDKLRADFDAKWPEGYDKMNAKDAPTPVAAAAAVQNLPSAAEAFGDADPVQAPVQAPVQTPAAAVQAAAAAAATEAPAQFKQQPYVQAEPVVSAVVTPPPVVEEPVAPVVPVQEAWEANGWKVHPSNAAFVYKDKEVKPKAEVNAMYAVPEVPTLPDVPEVPEVPTDAGDAIPPWAAPEA